MTHDAKSLRLERNYVEKRDFARMNVEAPLRLTNSQTSQKFTAQCKDLNAKGVLFESETQFHCDQKFDIEINPTSEKFDTLKARVRIVRSNLDINKQIYSTAAEIIELI